MSCNKFGILCTRQIYFMFAGQSAHDPLVKSPHDVHKRCWRRTCSLQIQSCTICNASPIPRRCQNLRYWYTRPAHKFGMEWPGKQVFIFLLECEGNGLYTSQCIFMYMYVRYQNILDTGGGPVCFSMCDNTVAYYNECLFSASRTQRLATASVVLRWDQMLPTTTTPRNWATGENIAPPWFVAHSV